MLCLSELLHFRPFLPPPAHVFALLLFYALGADFY